MNEYFNIIYECSSCGNKRTVRQKIKNNMVALQRIICINHNYAHECTIDHEAFLKEVECRKLKGMVV